MDCLKYRKFISLYADNELGSVQQEELLEHISICPDCKNALKNESFLKSCIKDSYDSNCDVDLSGRIMSKIHSNKRQYVRKNMKKSKLLKVAGSAALLILSLSFLTMSGINSGKTKTAGEDNKNLEKFVYEHMDKSAPEPERHFELTSVNFKQ